MREVASPSVGRDVDARGHHLLVLGIVLATGLALTFFAMGKGARPFSLMLFGLVFVAGMWFVRPFVALCSTVFLALVGDIITSPWWPYAKNLSSKESTLYIGRSINLSPVELLLIIAFVGLFVRYLVVGQWPFRLGARPVPVIVFVLFIVFGCAVGLSSGGDVQTTLFEVRPMFDLPLVFVLVVSVCRTAQHYRRLLWTVLAAIEVHALISLRYFATLTAAARSQSETVMEHTAALRMNVLFIVIIGAWNFRRISSRMRWTLLLLGLPVAVAYGVAQRRAAIASLGLALVFMGATLFWRQRRRFWRLVPALAIVGMVYVAAFWNTTSNIGFPAQGIKSVLAPNQISTRDKSSDAYRTAENFDLTYTVHQAPVQGIGFGKTFYRPEPLADISKFKYYLYIPHNSILWIWVSTGIGGFLALLYMLGSALSLGARRLREVADGSDVIVMFAAASFVGMFAIFAYVDMVWDLRDMMVLAISLATVANFPVRGRADAAAVARRVEGDEDLGRSRPDPVTTPAGRRG